MATAKKKKTKAAAAEPTVEIQPGLRENIYPTVAIVGRPNVGKSSLFNALIRKQVSITDARAGTTRDRVLHPIQFQERACDLMDTGGIGIVDAHNLSAHIEDQIAAALHTATVLVLVVDAKDGLTSLDREIASRLRKHNMPLIVAANKSEGIEAGYTVGEFESLGFSPVIATSAAHRLGLEDLEIAIAAHLPEKSHELSDGRLDNIPKIALCGRRNVGKSSFCNALAKQDRVIVSDMPGTTRDSVDLMMEKDDRKFCLIDTAGLRRMKEPEGPAEFYSQVRTERAIRRADVIMLMVDAVEGFSTTDRKTADMIIEMCKPCVIVVNKWDLAPGAVTGEYAKYVEGRLPTLRHSPICFTSAKSGTRCWQTLDVALDLYDLARTEIPTPVINQAVERAEREHEPPARKGKKPRLLYGLQVGVLPPTFVIHGRHTKLIDSKYKRYLNLRLGKFLGLSEIPLRLFLRDSSRK